MGQKRRHPARNGRGHPTGGGSLGEGHAGRRGDGVHTNGHAHAHEPEHPQIIRKTIASDFLEKRDLQRRILQAVEDYGYDHHTIFGVKLALEEALTNAIKHGNKLDSKKKVRVTARVSPRRLVVTVEDEGPGFNRNGVPNPLLDENLEKCSGRGILLIESYMDEVQWSNNGRCLRMIKLRESTHNGPPPKQASGPSL
jgi:serine/threonine-protein kinase RsbW